MIETALRDTDRRLGPLPAGPVRNMLSAIRAQLAFMAEVVGTGVPPTIEQKNRLNLGVIAVREYEADDPTYCDLLCDAVHRFRQL